MSRRFSLSSLLIAAGWLVFIIGAVRLGDVGFQSWQKQKESLRQTQEQLMRVEGWLSVEDRLAKRHQELLGSWRGLSGSALTWSALSHLQQAAQEQALLLTDLRPSWVEGRAGQGSLLRMDLKLEGELPKLAQFLITLPEGIPGIRLESLRILPTEGGKIQALLRLRLMELR